MYYAFLGHQKELAALEITALTGHEPEVISPEIVSIAPESKILTVADKLGGTTKIADYIATVSREAVLAELQKLISADPAKNVAISNYTNSPIPQSDIRNIKLEVAKSRSVRFVSFEDRGHELLMLSKQHVAEFNLIPENGQVTIAKTVWIYDSLGFAVRDRRKPYQDIKRGMLPVKLARTLVNLATRGKPNQTILDPFCGTGTILAEGLMVGCHVIGSDLDPESVAGTENNLLWLKAGKDQITGSFSVCAADAAHVDEHVKQVDAIVTEPHMGPLLDSRHELPDEKVKNIARGLDKLYRGALKSWLNILPVGGIVVITLPTFALSKRTIYSISVDTITSLGYNYVRSVEYSKPGATVIRTITILEKK